nr:hypothetical protein CFP56_66477 [Quercus suber]
MYASESYATKTNSTLCDRFDAVIVDPESGGMTGSKPEKGAGRRKGGVQVQERLRSLTRLEKDEITLA